MTTSSGGSDHLYEAALLTIVRLGEKQRCPWMPRLIEQIAKFWSTSSIDDWDSILRRTKASARQYDNPDRLEALLDKLIRRLRSKDPNGKTKYDGVRQSSDGTESTGEQTSKRSSTSRKWKSSIRQAKELLQSELGRQVCQSLSTLSIRQELEFDDSSILRLAVPPTFVNSTKQFLELQEELSQATVVAIDTEWHDAKNESDQPDHGRIRGVEVSTFQIAFLASHRENETLTYVIDIKQQRPRGASIDDDNYWTLVRDLIASILENPRKVVLGFSVGHDLPVLELFIGRKLQPTSLLDLQTILANNHDQSGSSLPGLKTCAAYYSQVPLSKEHQMSDWGRRPLSQPQLNYAGLDAAILLFLLAEYNASTLK